MKQIQWFERSSPFIFGVGKSFASFGEIAQGQLTNGSHFLCTLPIDLWSVCLITCTHTPGEIVIECDFEKTKCIVALILKSIGICSNVRLSVYIHRNIPVGKGLSSSTADMLGAIRAMQSIFSFEITNEKISELMVTVEPHDALHYGSCAAYDHRQGKLLRKFEYVPQWTILAVDTGGTVETIEYNAKLFFSDLQKEAYDKIYYRLLVSFTNRDDRSIAACATESSRLHAVSHRNATLIDALELWENLGALGLIVAHSGTYIGFVFPSQARLERRSHIIQDIERRLNQSVFMIRTILPRDFI